MKNIIWIIVLLIGLGFILSAFLFDDGPQSPISNQPINSNTNITENIPLETRIVEVAPEKNQFPERIITESVKTPEKILQPFKPRIAVLPFQLLGFDNFTNKDLDQIVADAMLNEIDSDNYELFERSQLKTLLDAKGFEQSTLVDNLDVACQAGKLAKVKYFVLGTLTQDSGQYHISARIVDCQDTRIIQRQWLEFDSYSQWRDKIPELTNLLNLRKGSAITHYAEDKLIESDIFTAVNPSPDFNISLATEQNKKFYRQGQYIRFVLSCPRDCYITLITVDNMGNGILLLPNKYQPSAFIRRNQKINIPSDDAGFRFPIQPPHGQTLVKAIATLKPLTLSGITAALIEKDGFVDISSGVKAIGLEGIPADQQHINSSSLHEILSHSSWATAELTIITAASETSQSNTGPVNNTITPFTMNPNNDANVNEQILQRWQDITRSTLRPPTLNLQTPTNPFINNKPTELLIVYKGQNQLKKISGNTNINTLLANPEIEAVAPNLKVFSYSMPPTKLIDVQWALKNQFKPNNDIGWEKAVGKVNASQLPLIGVVDSQIDINDPRLKNVIWQNSREIPSNGIDDDRNGYIDDVNGYNFTNASGVVYRNSSKFSHGSFIASIIAGQFTNSPADVVGVVPEARIISAVALNNADNIDPWNSQGQLDNVIKAIEYTADQGARVINLSFGVQVDKDQLQQLNKLPIWDQLQAKGVILVCAAGNSDLDNDEYPVFPASLPRENIISVMATDPQGGLGKSYDPISKSWENFTNYGVKSVDIAAPGTLILGISGPGQTQLMSGTSYSAAIVTGVTAAIWSQNPNWPYKQVIAKLRSNANKSLQAYCRDGTICIMN
ncbi:MAG: S8 family serine peptidase [Phycisphaerae bacterium]|nr:S8 family serine peptidase [Phycisphaerae bacterium]